jgi:hypothetical protein
MDATHQKGRAPFGDGSLEAGHEEELMTNWQRAVNLLPLERMLGADND